MLLQLILADKYVITLKTNHKEHFAVTSHFANSLYQCFRMSAGIVVSTLHASCGTVYCNRSCLWLCVCLLPQ